MDKGKWDEMKASQEGFKALLRARGIDGEKADAVIKGIDAIAAARFALKRDSKISIEISGGSVETEMSTTCGSAAFTVGMIIRFIIENMDEDTDREDAARIHGFITAGMLMDAISEDGFMEGIIKGELSEKAASQLKKLDEFMGLRDSYSPSSEAERLREENEALRKRIETMQYALDALMEKKED